MNTRRIPLLPPTGGVHTRRTALALAMAGLVGAVMPGVPARAESRWPREMADFDAEFEAGFAPGTTLFLGSSSIRGWPALAADFPDIDVLQRGLNGARLADIISRYERLAGRFAPRRLVVFAGSNDIVPRKATDPRVVAEGVKALFETARGYEPAPDMIWIEITPTPRRAAVVDVVLRANALVRELAEGIPDLHVLRTARLFLDDAGQPNRTYFVNDGLHLNARGYALWRAALDIELGRLG